MINGQRRGTALIAKRCIVSPDMERARTYFNTILHPNLQITFDRLNLLSISPRMVPLPISFPCQSHVRAGRGLTAPTAPQAQCHSASGRFPNILLNGYWASRG